MQASEGIAKQFSTSLALNKIWGSLIVNVKAFGAKGNGSTDDTGAIQAAIDYAIEIGKQEVNFPPGTYKYGTLTNTAGLTFIGDGVTLDGTTVISLVNMTQLAGLTRPEITIDVTAPPKGTGLLPLTKTNPAQDQVRLQAIFDYIKSKEVTYQPAAEQSTGWNYSVYFPNGIYEWSTSVILKGKYLKIKADRAIIRTTDNSYAFTSTTDAGWKLDLDGFSFDRCGGLKQDNNNIESGRTNITNCWFYYSPAEAVWLTKQSSMTFIDKCHFYKCTNIAYFDKTDAVYINKCWFSEASRTAAKPTNITNKTKLFIKDTFFIPAPQPDTSFEMAWIRNEDYVLIENCRVSSEPGAKTIVHNYAAGSPGSPYNPNGVEIINNNPLAVTVGDGSLVRLFALPNILRVRGNALTPTITKPLGYGTGYTAADAASFAGKQDVIVVDVTGNVGQTSSAWSVPTELKPFVRFVDLLSNGNLGLGETNPQQPLHISGATGAMTRFERKDADNTIVAGDLYGGIEFVGNDASSNSAGVRADIRVESEGTLGEVGVVFNVAGSASATLNEMFRINRNGINVKTPKTPASATATGTQGDICWDTNYVYICVAANTWKRSAIATW